MEYRYGCDDGGRPVFCRAISCPGCGTHAGGGVSVDGESLEGLTEAEAEEQVQSRVDEKLAREVALTIGEMSFAASSGDLGIAWKNEDQVRQALKDAEVKGNLIQRYMKKKGSGSGAGGSGLEFSADPEKISAFVDAECKDAVREASDASITRKTVNLYLPRRWWGPPWIWRPQGQPSERL